MKISAHDLPTILGATLDEVATKLEASSAPFMLIGGLAVGVHAQARATKDIGLAVRADSGAASAIVRAMEDAGFVAAINGPLGPGAVVRFSRTGADGVDRWIDMLFAGTPFEERAIDRATGVTVLGRKLPVVSLEDLVVYKLIAGRPQDIADAVALLREHATSLDRAYLDSAVAEWELEEALEHARALAEK